MSETAVARMRSKLAQTYARKLVTGSSLLACGVAAGVAAASSHRVAVALAAAALVIEIGSAFVVMRRGLKAFDEMVRRDR